MQLRRNHDIVDEVASVILAGGQGTRLYPLTKQRCKPSVCFGGRYRLIDVPISNSLNSNIRRIFVISQYYATGLNHHIQATYHLDLFQKGSIELIGPQEVRGEKIWFKGTADAIRQNIDSLLQTPCDYFLILSGDQLYNINFAQMLDFAKQKNADLTIASLPIEEKEARRMGVLKINEQQKITSFIEKPQDQKVLSDYALKPSAKLDLGFSTRDENAKFLGSMGIYIFKRQALAELVKEEGEDFGKHLIPLQVKKGNTFAYCYQGYWEDIGTISSFFEANIALTSNKPCLYTYDENNPIYTCPYNIASPIIKNTKIEQSLISQGSIIEAKEISRSVIGVRCRIKKGTILRDTVILGNHFYNCPPHRQNQELGSHFTMGEDCFIQKTIIDEMCSIGNRVHLTNKAGLTHYDGQGIYIRDGIIVVASGTHLPDDFSL